MVHVINKNILAKAQRSAISFYVYIIVFYLEMPTDAIKTSYSSIKKALKISGISKIFRVRPKTTFLEYRSLDKS